MLEKVKWNEICWLVGLLISLLVMLYSMCFTNDVLYIVSVISAVVCFIMDIFVQLSDYIRKRFL